MCDKLLFYIENDSEYTISLYQDIALKKQILSKSIKDEKISVPDKEWITENTQYFTIVTDEKMDINDLVRFKKETTSCSYKEKYVYKYEIIKEYYDDNYHLNIEGYLKDIDDYKVYYKGEPIVNTIEIIQEKTIEVPKTEYIYIENTINENDSSNQTQCQEDMITKTVIETKTEFVEKEVYKVPKKVYVIILILLITVILLLIKSYRKYVE